MSVWKNCAPVVDNGRVQFKNDDAAPNVDEGNDTIAVPGAGSKVSEENLEAGTAPTPFVAPGSANPAGANSASEQTPPEGGPVKTTTDAPTGAAQPLAGDAWGPASGLPEQGNQGAFKPVKRRRRRRLWLALTAVLVVALTAAAMLIPVPYVIESPGPTYDVLGKSGDVPFIEVHSDKATYDTSGQLRMVTVANSGGPFSTVTLGQVLMAKLDGVSQVSPAKDLYPKDMTAQELEEISKAQMTQSQSTAAAAALEELGYPVKGVVRIEGAVKDGPLEGKVEEGDILRAIITPDGVRHEVDRPSVPFAVAHELAPESNVTMVVERGGKTLEIHAKTYKPQEVPLDFAGSKFGVYLTAKVDLPFDVKIHLERVGGPSAGTMFALGIIDHLTGGDTTGGVIVAGTGAIGYDGQVQPIGGIAQKMHGAQADGAQWFLAPRSNCDEVVGNIPDGLQVWPVSTLKEARAALASIKAGATGEHPTCEAALEGK